jgi:hypothetical protein
MLDNFWRETPRKKIHVAEPGVGRRLGIKKNISSRSRM